MQPLASHRSEVTIGKPLPFGICDATGRLLLARGHVIESDTQFDALLDRGAFIDRSAGASPEQRVAQARSEELPALWDDGLNQLGQLLRADGQHSNFESALDNASKPVLALIERDSDLAIFQVVQQHGNPMKQYASRRAVHTSIACYLAAQRLGWSSDEARRVFRAALTMNVSMAELQNRLATQMTPLTVLQREQIRSHPQRSVELLEQTGVTDKDWLSAVLQHHEYNDGTGYPLGLKDSSEMAQMLQLADVFTAKLSARAQRSAIAPDAAARALYARDGGRHPIAAALIKEFGIYPPGCVVRLKSGEIGMVVRRGETASKPVVMALVNRDGDPLITPLRRMTAKPEHAIAAVLPRAALKVHVAMDKLVALAAD